MPAARPALLAAGLAVTLTIGEVAPAAPPVGFIRTPVATNLDRPTSLAFLPDGRLLIGEQAGRIRIVVGGVPQPVPVVQLEDVPSDGDIGLLGMAVDPAFAANSHIYIYHTTDTPSGRFNRVVRLTMSGDTAPLNSLVTVWQNPETCYGSSHHGGAIAFGTDGNLLVPTGDQFNSNNAQNLLTQHGKILRMRPDGSAPPDNPFIGQQGVSPLIWAVGSRNPFRSAVDPVTGFFYISDVGLNTWEEIDRVTPAANLGWPMMEGPQCFVPSCSGLVAPIKGYSHTDPVYVTNLSGEESAAVILGPVYRGNAFPPEYVGNLFFGDYVNGWIRRLVLDGSGAVAGEFPFDTAPDAGTIVDMETGPDGALYCADIFAGPYGQAVYKIAYVPGGNLPPTAVAAAAPVSGQPTLNVSFSGDQSADPDHGPSILSYQWDFGDGQASTEANPTHAYPDRGLYRAHLTVSDGDAQAVSPDILIAVGGVPAPVISEPAVGTTYRAGQTINFSGAATDPEDGVLPATAFVWTVYLVHQTHLHPAGGAFQSRSGSLFIPDAGHPPDNTSYRIDLSVTDSNGLQTTISRTIEPQTSPLTFQTAPPGIPIFLDTGPLATPTIYPSLVGFQHHAEAQLQFTLYNRRYLFQGWDHAADAAFDFMAPVGGTSFRALYAMACPADWNGDHAYTPSDIAQFVNDWFNSVTGPNLIADYDANGVVNPADISVMVQDWLARIDTSC